MAPKKKKNKLLVKIVSGAGTGFFYLFKKTPAIAQRKIAIRKFDPIVNQYVIFNEAKLKYSTTLRPITNQPNLLQPQQLFQQIQFTTMNRINQFNTTYNTRNIMFATAALPTTYFAWNWFNNKQQPKQSFQ